MKHSARKASVKPSSRAASKRRVVKSPIKKRAAPASKRKAEPNKVRDVRRASLLHIADLECQIAAIDKAQAVIEFGLDGRILEANENFLNTLGYSANEVRSQHHSMFLDAAERQTPEYRAFWERLGRGEYDAGRYRRVAKGGREVWIQASYNPILNLNGTPFKVVKYATDVTEQVRAEQALQAAVAETGAIVAAAQVNDLSRRISVEDKRGQIAERLGARTDGERAAALELALEALYLAKKLDKTTGEGETVYG